MGRPKRTREKDEKGQRDNREREGVCAEVERESGKGFALVWC